MSKGSKNKWQLAALDDVCNKIQDGAHNSPKVQFDEGGRGRFLYITSKNIRNNIIDLSNISYVDQKFHDQIYPRCTPEVGDVLLTKDGANTGNVTINTISEPFSLLSSVALIKTKQSILMPEFLKYYLQSPDGLSQLIGQMTGTAIKRIILRDLKAATIPLPSRAEQERIVAILDDAFEGIATATANAKMNLEKVQDVLDGELHSLLSKPSNGWMPLTLAEVASDYGRGKSKHRPRNDSQLYGGPYPFVQTGDVRNAEQFITTYSQTYNERGLSQSKLWPKGTLCITIAANIAETAILDFDACFPDSVIGVVANPSKANTRFIEYQVRVAKAQLQAKGKGSAQDNINLGTFETHMFFFPPPRIQEKIVERLDSLALLAASLTEVIEQKVTLLDELKQSLLHQAFTGKL